MNMSLDIRRILLGSLFATLLTAQAVAGGIFNGAPNNQTGSHGYYYAITGDASLLPPEQTRNGDNASGGVMRRIYDDPYWGSSIDVWHKDDWFTETAGLALTLESGGSTVYTNNGIEAGDGSFYNGTGTAESADVPGLYRGYSMSNNFDHIYASYFLLTEETTFDTIIGYFDANSGLDPFDPTLQFHMNLWSETTDGSLLPVNTGSFMGDVFSSDTTAGAFAVSDSGIDRIFGDNDGNATDDIWRLEYTLDSPVTLAAGGYYFSHDASIVVPEPSSLALLGMGSLGLIGCRRRRRKTTKLAD